MSSNPPPPSVPPPPPYCPLFPEGPTAPVFPPGFVSPRGSFGSPYQQTFPQSFLGGGDHSYYQGSPGPVGPMSPHGVLLTQPGYQVGPPNPSKHTVYVMDRQGEEDGGGRGAANSCLAALSTVLCCCSVLPMAIHHCCNF